MERPSTVPCISHGRNSFPTWLGPAARSFFQQKVVNSWLAGYSEKGQSRAGNALPGLTPLWLSLQRLHQHLTVGRRTERGGKNGERGAVEHHPDGRKTAPIESSITIRDCAWR